MTIMCAVTLSLYRINNTRSHLALFIGVSVINSVYVCMYTRFLYSSAPSTNPWMPIDVCSNPPPPFNLCF